MGPVTLHENTISLNLRPGRDVGSPPSFIWAYPAGVDRLVRMSATTVGGSRRIAVDDTVYAQLPFTPGWNKVNPKEYGAPDPSNLVGEDGFAGLLEQTESPEAGESVRGGADNTEILTTYTGTVPGSAMKSIIPSSSGDSFDVEWQVTDDGELREATLTGVFYPHAEPMTYTVDFADYGTEKDITAP